MKHTTEHTKPYMASVVSKDYDLCILCVSLSRNKLYLSTLDTLPAKTFHLRLILNHNHNLISENGAQVKISSPLISVYSTVEHQICSDSPTVTASLCIGWLTLLKLFSGTLMLMKEDKQPTRHCMGGCACEMCLCLLVRVRECISIFFFFCVTTMKNQLTFLL